MASFFRNVRIAIERLFRRLKGQSPGFFRLGSCNRCGACCSDVVLSIDGKKITKAEDFNRLMAEDKRYSIFSLKMINPEGVYIFFCTKLDEHNRCTIYQDRPEICVDYPSPDLLKCGTDVIEGCGFYLVPPVDFRKLLDTEMKE
jgi:uncharacterized protein